MDKKTRLILLTGPIFGLAYFTARKQFMPQKPPPDAKSESEFASASSVQEKAAQN
jgi:hypothetical protein